MPVSFHDSLQRYSVRSGYQLIHGAIAIRAADGGGAVERAGRASCGRTVGPTAIIRASAETVDYAVLELVDHDLARSKLEDRAVIRDTALEGGAPQYS